MPVSHVHVVHAPEHIPWLAQVELTLQEAEEWTGTSIHRIELDSQKGFVVATAVNCVRRAPGPVLFVGKVQARLRIRFEEILGREYAIYDLQPTAADHISDALWEAFRAADRGEPLMSQREAIAFLIIAKLRRQNKWGGSAKFKDFLWIDLLPKGGFPKELSKRDIRQVADKLCSVGVLKHKESEGQLKIALGDKATIEHIIEQRQLIHLEPLEKFFRRDKKLVPISMLNYND